MQPYQQLEKQFGEFTGQQHMVACSSGTAALHLALETLRARHGWKDGDEVLVPDYTMVACARAVTLAGLTPVFVDCGDDLLMNRDTWYTAVTERTEAVMIVHIYGRQWGFGKDWGRAIPVIEDLAEGHGLAPHKFTAASCWSFYQNKIIAGEEGGAVSFSQEEDAAVCRELRSLGFGPEQNYIHRPRGHNYRLANCLAENVLWSLENYKDNATDRAHDWRLYSKQDFGKRIRARPEPEAKWVYDLWVPGMTWAKQDVLVTALKEKGIAARHGFRPLHQQPEYKGCRYVGTGNSIKMSEETLYLPLTPGLVTTESIETAARIVREVTSTW